MNRKTTLLSLKLLLALIFSQGINAQVIYTNGPISTGTTTSSVTPVTAPAGYTWSELQTPNTTLGGGMIYNSAVPPADFSLADDFVVPAGQTWNITSADFYGYQTNYASTTVPPFDEIRVRIWNGDPAAGGTVVAGNMTTNAIDLAGSANTFVYRVATATTGTARRVWRIRANITTSLAPGNLLDRVSSASGATTSGTGFAPPVTILGTTSDPTWNAQQRTGAAWAPYADGGSLNPLAMPFEVNGTVLGVNSYEFASNITLSPNPATSVITISDQSNGTDGAIEIYDLMGRMVKSQKATELNGLQVNVGDLSFGTYTMKVSSQNGVAVKKFIKE